MTKHLTILLLSVLFVLAGLYASAAQPPDWRAWDVTADSRFNQADLDQALGEDLATFQLDANGDGEHNLADLLHLLVQLSTWDRTGDVALSDEDFAQVALLSLPEPDADAASALVDGLVAEGRLAVPPDAETKLFASLPVDVTLTIHQRALLLQLAGMSALGQGNVEAAEWAFGRAFQTYPELASALGNLAFCLAQSDRHEDALVLLARARELNPKSAATLTTLGWLFARHGQQAEATAFYKEAVELAPELSRYQLNYGVALLRQGKQSEAHQAFLKAAEANAGELQAFVLAFATEPEPPPHDLDEFRDEYEQYRDDLREQGLSEEELPAPWQALSPCDQVQAIMERLADRYSRKMTEHGQNLSDRCATRLVETMQPYLPRGKKAKEDMQLWADGVQLVWRTEEELAANAERDQSYYVASQLRREGSELVSMEGLFHQLALQQAEVQAVAALEAMSGVLDQPGVSAAAKEQAKAGILTDALEQALRDCYYSPINHGLALMRYQYVPSTLSAKSTVEVPPFYGIPLAIMGAFPEPPSYWEGEGEVVAPAVTYGGDTTLCIDLVLVSFEWDMESGELELKAGQGLFVAGTWSPAAGFGFQVGAGVDLKFMGAGRFEASQYIKFGSDGSVSAQGDLGLRVGKGAFSTGFESNTIVPIQAATHEPIASL